MNPAASHAHNGGRWAASARCVYAKKILGSFLSLEKREWRFLYRVCLLLGPAVCFVYWERRPCVTENGRPPWSARSRILFDVFQSSHDVRWYCGIEFLPFLIANSAPKQGLRIEGRSARLPPIWRHPALRQRAVTSRPILDLLVVVCWARSDVCSNELPLT